MNNPREKKQEISEEDNSNGEEIICKCVEDPLGSLPPELRPKQRTWKSRLRKTTCPGCGLIYWTNRDIDYCSKCTTLGLGQQASTANGHYVFMVGRDGIKNPFVCTSKEMSDCRS